MMRWDLERGPIFYVEVQNYIRINRKYIDREAIIYYNGINSCGTKNIKE